MSDSTSTAAAAHDAGHAHDHAPHYKKIWSILVGLLVLSVIGPIVAGYLPGTTKLVVTLITAFGIAVVKAFLVAKHFMHITMERKYITWLVFGMLAFMLVFFGGVSPDVLKHDGLRWENQAAKVAVEQGLKEGVSEHGRGFHEAGHEGGGHEAAPAEHHE